MAQTFSCPSCGAPLEPQGEKTTIICKFCGESVIVPEGLREHPHHSRSHSSAVPDGRPPVPITIDLGQPSRNYMRPLIIGLVIFVVASVVLPLLFAIVPLAIGLFAMFASFNHGNTSASPVTQQIAAVSTLDVRVERPVIFSPGTDTTTPDFLALIQDKTSDAYQFAMVGGKTHNILWRSEDLGKNGDNARGFFLDKQVMIINDTTFSALDRQTGKQIWKTPLQNGLGYCKTCLVQVGSNVVVLQKDGTLQAVDAASGKLTWNKTLNSGRYDVFLINGQLAAQDNDDKSMNIIYIFDSVTGKITQQLQPMCPAKSPEMRFGRFELNPDGKSMLFLYENCVQTVSMPDGKVLTEVVSPQSDSGESAWPIDWFLMKYLTAGDSIFYSQEGSPAPLNMMSVSRGNPKTLVSDKKYTLTPSFLKDNLLVVEAIPSYDGKQVEYWGIDTVSGKRLWQYGLKGQGDLTYHDMRSTRNGIFVVQCREKPNSCAWASVDPKTGVGSNSGTNKGGFFAQPAWFKDSLYLENDGEVAVINTLNGQQLYQWP